MSDYKRTKLLPPYTAEGKTTFPARNVPGVYLIYKVQSGLLSEERKLQYVGYGRKDVYKAMYRHFQEWNDRQAEAGLRGERITYKLRGTIRVRVIYCSTPARAAELERALIIKHRPPHNPDKLELYELTEHGAELTALPQSAEYITDLEAAPF
jgi:hypothetical protein